MRIATHDNLTGTASVRIPERTTRTEEHHFETLAHSGPTFRVVTLTTASFHTQFAIHDLARHRRRPRRIDAAGCE
jgi:hypothetical protein